VRQVFVLIVFGAALGFAAVVLAILGFGLYGQLSRLRRAVAAAEAEVVPALATLRAESPPGRHRAG
jgi:hypothetical protein